MRADPFTSVSTAPAQAARMERQPSRRRRIALWVFITVLVVILLLGAWRAVQYHRDGAQPSNANAPAALASAQRP